MYVKFVEHDSSVEVVECMRVRVLPGYANETAKRDPVAMGMMFEMQKIDGRLYERIATEGNVYLMNDDGKTIDMFDLDR